jgi:hypothetical protein
MEAVAFCDFLRGNQVLAATYFGKIEPVKW